MKKKIDRPRFLTDDFKLNNSFASILVTSYPVETRVMQELDFLKEYLFCRSPNLKDYLCQQLLYFIIDDDYTDIDLISIQTKVLLGKVFFCPSVTVQFPLEERETSCGKVAKDAEALLAALIREVLELTIEECQILTIFLLERLLERELDEELTLKIKSLVQS